MNWSATALLDDIEQTNELRWPQSVQVYEKMRRTSGKVAQSLRAITLPIRGTRYFIRPNGAKDEIVERLADELDLPIDGLNPEEQPRRVRTRGRFSFREHWREVQEALIFGHMCVDYETEALTQDGWKRGDELEVGDLLLTLNPDTGMSEWHPVEKMRRYEGRHAVRHLEGRSHSSVTTLDHNWIVRTSDTKQLRFRKTHELNTNDAIITAAPAADLPTTPKWSDALVELVAWYFTEGQEHPGGGIALWQSETVNPRNVDRIRACLRELFGPPRERLHHGHGPPLRGWRECTQTGGVSRGQITYFYLDRAAAEEVREIAPGKVVRASWIRELTAAQLRLFIETAIDADGCRSQGKVSFSQKDRARVDCMQIACSLLGIPAHIYPDKSNGYTLRVGKLTDIRPVNSARQRERGLSSRAIDQLEQVEDGVWCPSVKNRTWLARRRGTVYYTGNCFFQLWRVDSEDYYGMKKLSPRMPHTLSEINLAPDGMLASIKQTPASFTSGRSSWGQEIEIKIEDLVWYAIDRVGANWIGFSILRQAYFHWLVQHRLVRVDAVTKERNGMGVPVMERTIANLPTPGEEAAAESISRNLRAGEFAGVRLPYGYRLRIQGVEGSLPDTLASAKWHGEEIAGSMLTQFLSLGHTETGARAVGEVHQDVYEAALMAVLEEELGVFNAHQVEDWVDLNWGPDEPAPKVDADEIDEELSEEGMKALADAGALVFDKSLRSHVRRTRHLPPEDEEPEPEPKPPVLAAGSRRGRRLRAQGRTFRRELFDHELAAQTNFLAIDAQWQSSLATLIGRWKTDVRAPQIDELVAAITELVDAGDIAALGELTASSGLGADVLSDVMTDMAKIGRDGALAEASAQGASVDEPDLDAVDARLAKRAAATNALLTRSLSEAAGRRAVLLSGGSLSGVDVATQVRTHLEGLTDAYLEDQLGGSLTAAQNSGRTAVFEENPPARIYASELLDEATCSACSDIDGKEYATVEEAEADYPSGGFSQCLGGPRCRGTLVSVYAEATATAA